MGLYWSVGGYGSISDEIPYFALMSFGNMGFAKAQCSREYINYGHGEFVHLNFMCEKTTVISEVYSSGIMLSEQVPNGSDNAIAVCHEDMLETGTESYAVNRKFKRDWFNEKLMKQCAGENTCRPEVRKTDFFDEGNSRKLEALMDPNLVIFA